MRLDGVLLMLLAGSLALNVWLGLDRQAGPDAATQPPSSLPAGTRLPPLSGRTLDGRRFRIDPGATRTETAVYVFSARCSWCERDLNNIRTLAGRRGDTIRFLAVSTGPEDLRSLREYARAVAFNLEVVSDVPADQRTAYGLDGTPQLLVLGNDGRLRRAFKGALQGRTLEESGGVLRFGPAGHRRAVQTSWWGPQGRAGVRRSLGRGIRSGSALAGSRRGPRVLDGRLDA